MLCPASPAARLLLQPWHFEKVDCIAQRETTDISTIEVKLRTMRPMLHWVAQEMLQLSTT
jgi:hypothetical protein